MPNSHHKGFDDLEHRYLEALPLSSQNLSTAESLMNSGTLREQGIACGAVLRDLNSPSALKAQAIERLRQLCVDYDGRDALSKNEILITLLLIPAEAMKDEALHRFAYSSASADRFTTRANAMMVLERLSRLGDARSKELLESALEDPDETVRANARIALERL